MVTEELNRIDSVRKTKEEYLRERMKQRDISDLYSDLRIRISREDSYGEQRKMAEQAIRRRMKQIPTTDELFEKVSFGPIQVRMEPVRGWIEPYGPMAMVKDLSKTTEALVANHGVKVILNGGYLGYEVAYGAIGAEIPVKKHGSSFHYKRNKTTSYHIVDIPSLLTDVLLRNSLLSYAKQHMKYMRRELARKVITSIRRYTTSAYIETGPSELLAAVKELCPDVHDLASATRVDVYRIFPADFWSVLCEEEGSWDLMLSRSDLRNLVYELALYPFLQEVCSLHDDAEDREESQHTYAKAWQLKKNIPQKTLARMQQNAFLSHYGTVELDADVDLEKFTEIETEFRRMMSIVPFPKALENSFRIRKLGRYRAAGIYFPGFKATLVDLDGVSSFMHEGAHQVDHGGHNGDRLSDQFDFLDVYERYELAVRRNVSKLPVDDPFVIRWKGTTKYNANYYLRRTEVFARSFELYLHEVKGIRSSFLDASYDSPVYPKDPDYLKAVEAYFDRVMPANPDAEQSVWTPAQAPASPPHILEYFVDEETGQMVFPI